MVQWRVAGPEVGGGIIHQIYANGSVHEVRGVQRQPRDLRWRKEALEVIASTSWNREPAAPGAGELRVLPPLAPPAAAQGAEVEEPEVHVPEYNPHRVFIRLKTSSATASRQAAAGASLCEKDAARRE